MRKLLTTITRLGETLSIFESQPQCRTIFSVDANFQQYKHFLQFPYSVFGVYYLPPNPNAQRWPDNMMPKNTNNNYFFSDLYVGFSETPITSTNDLLYFLPLGNQYPSFKMCLGLFHRFYASEEELINSAIGGFWQIPFTRQFDVIGGWKELTKIRSFKNLLKGRRNKKISEIFQLPANMTLGA